VIPVHDRILVVAGRGGGTRVPPPSADAPATPCEDEPHEDEPAPRLAGSA
jgi:hypothetical protein